MESEAEPPAKATWARCYDQGFVARYLCRKCDCGSRAIQLLTRKGWTYTGEVKQASHLRCTNCGAQTRSRKTPALAMVSWDRKDYAHAP